MNLTPFDRIHAHVRGRLTPTEELALERELVQDEALRCFASDYRAVHAWTASADEFSSTRIAFEALVGRIEERPTNWTRRAAAAAILVTVAGAAYWLGRASRSSQAEPPVALVAIELEPSARASPIAADLPAEWADYDPRGDGRVRFLSSLEEAQELARLTERPLLVYGSYPGCPMCAALDARVFSACDVVALAERVVPVRMNLAALSEAEQRSFTARGYPFLEMWRASGETTHALARNPDPRVFLESLHDGLERSGATGEQPAWSELRERVARFQAARAAEREGHLAAAEAAFLALARSSAPADAIVARALAGLTRLSDLARESLLDARTLASSDLQAARAKLGEARRRFAGTRFEPDLAAVLERLERDGRFPRLVESDRSS
jgi:hypothetical protein